MNEKVPLKVWFLASDEVRARTGVLVLVPTLGATVAAILSEHTLLAAASFTLSVLAAVGFVRMRTPDMVCAFCSRSRRDVSQLVAGPTASICDECVALCQSVVLGQATDLNWALQILMALPNSTARTVTNALFKACAALEATKRTELVHTAFRFHDYETAVRIIEAVPEADRTPGDWLNVGCAYEYCERATQAVAAAQKAGSDVTQLAWVLNNVASARLAGPQELEPGELEQIIVDCKRARSLAAEHQDAARLGFLVASCWGTSAEASRRLGRLEEAEQSLREAERIEAHWWRLVVRARLARMRNDQAEVTRVLNEASTLVHPESKLVTLINAERQQPQS